MTKAAVLAQMGNTNQTFRNRIINGAMMIDQRNAGASVSATVTSARTYVLDRWGYFTTQASKFSIQQNAGSVTPPAGFKNYIGITSSSAYTPISSDIIFLQQPIEGYNVADLGFGLASASPITVSFWVRSSLTGTFAGSLGNASNNRLYPFTFVINSANTWEQKSFTVSGDTTGTWATDNTVGLYLNFNLGTGSTYLGAAGSWTSSAYYSATGGTNIVGTNGATFYITGVQLEAGTTATPFELRSYGTELALCQRYYEMSYDIGTAPGTATTTGIRFFGMGISGATTGGGGIVFQIPKRSAPTIVTYDGAGTANNVSTVPTSSTTFTNGRAYTGAPFNISTNGFMNQGQGSVGNVYNFCHFTASAEL